MNKKGDISLSLTQVIEIILFSLIAIFVLLPLGVMLWNYFVPSMDTEVQNSLDRLALEIKDLKIDLQEKQIGAKTEIIVPLDLKKDINFLLFAKKPNNLLAELQTSYCKQEGACLCVLQVKTKVGNRQYYFSKCTSLGNIDVEQGKNKIDFTAETYTGITNIKVEAEKQEKITIAISLT